MLMHESDIWHKHSLNVTVYGTSINFETNRLRLVTSVAKSKVGSGNWKPVYFFLWP